MTNIGEFTKSEAEIAVEKFIKGDSSGSFINPDSVDKEAKKEEAPTEGDLGKEIKDLEQEINTLEKSPQLTFEQKLEKYGLSNDEAAAIVDSLLAGMPYKHTYKITSKYSVTFKTRTMDDQGKVTAAIERLAPQFPTTIGTLISKYNLAASIVSFRGIDYEKKSWEEREKWVLGLPEAVMTLLTRKLARFDEMVLDLLDEGAVENF